MNCFISMFHLTLIEWCIILRYVSLLMCDDLSKCHCIFYLFWEYILFSFVNAWCIFAQSFILSVSVCFKFLLQYPWVHGFETRSWTLFAFYYNSSMTPIVMLICFAHFLLSWFVAFSTFFNIACICKLSSPLVFVMYKELSLGFEIVLTHVLKKTKMNFWLSSYIFIRISCLFHFLLNFDLSSTCIFSYNNDIIMNLDNYH